jgi:murein DD-endopeptidase MepM/ murein hydrolase activator NlpD
MLPFGSKPVSWSPDGQYLLAAQGTRLFLIQADKRETMNVALECDGGVCWLPDSSGFILSTPKSGIYLVPLKGVATKLIPEGNFAALSPDGNQIAYVGPAGKSEGLWIAASNGETPRKKNDRAGIKKIEWSPDGRTLALVNEANQLLTAKVTGEISKPVASLTSKQISWSPDSKWILAHTKEGSALLNTSNWKATPLAEITSLSWLKANQLTGLKKGVPVLVTLNKETPEIKEVTAPVKDLTSLLVYQGVNLQGAKSDPLKGVPPPTAGHYVLRGLIDNVDPVKGNISLRVTRVTSPDGVEKNFANPVRKSIQAKQIPAGIKPDVEAVITVKGESFDKELSAVSFKVEASGTILVENPNPGAPPNAPGALRPKRTNIEKDGVTMDVVTVPLIFPVLGKVSWNDSFLSNRGGGSRRHHGQDIMAPKMRPVVACFDGTVIIRKNNNGNAGNMITLVGDNGYNALYIHLNNDTPGTDDGLGTERYSVAPNLQTGDRVVAGQFLGWVGDSGNAENSGSHLHFELHDAIGGGILNAVHSLKAAQVIDEPVYIDPDPSLKPKQGEMRWDVVVVSADEATGTILADVVGWTINNKLSACVTADRITIKLPSGAPLRADAQTTLALKDFRKGLVMSLTGKPGAFIEPTSVWVDIPPTSDKKK